MRVKNSIINVSSGIGSQIIIVILSFVSRTVFVNSLGVEYLGINGLFTNVLGMLSLAEAGLGASIVYSLYKPVADKDEEKMLVLMKLYKRAYLVIGLVILLLGVGVTPFLDSFVKGSTVEHIYIIYFIFLINTASTYFFTHKISFLNVSQKGYIVTAIYTLSSLVLTTTRIGILYFTQNYILYLLIEIIVTITTSFILSILVDRMYPFLKNNVSSKLDNETKGTIIKNVKASVLHNIGGYCVFGTDNLIISSYVGVAAVGLYSNYYMIMNICRTFINQFFDNIYHSVGNLVAEESNDKVYSVFKITMLFNFWIYSFFTIFLYNILELLISVWLGSAFIMAKGVLIILLINFYVSGMRRSITMVKTAAGIFHEDRYAPFFEAGVNLIASLMLVQYLGISGVFIGTLISTLVVPFWTAPYFVYKKVFHISVLKYFQKYLFYSFLGLITLYITGFVCNYIFLDGYLKLFLIGVVCLVIPNLIYFCIFRKTEEFKYILTITKHLSAMILGRIGKLSKRKKVENVQS